MDAVNEFAIERSGEPVLIVDGDTVEVEDDIMQEVLEDV